MVRLKRAVALLLVMVMVCAMLVTGVSAATAQTKEVRRAIGIVFDNSGSMYVSGNNCDPRAWCRATYAMEAFANMMNPNDVMQIYPMWDIEVGGKTYTDSAPLKITQSDASKIRDIYTPFAGGTPIETITAAYNGLMNTSADEKWLIVLTDGTYFHKDANKLTEAETKTELGIVLNDYVQNVNVMYLGIGSNAVLPSDVSGACQYYADKASESKDVLSKLTAMCNMIFGRDTLPNVKNAATFDIPMSKLILFVQGNGISNVKLGDLKAVSSSEMKYSTKGASGDYATTFKIDETLQGTMVVYNDVDAGTYNLNYDGEATSVVCYYEPDVDLKVELLDANGNPVDVNSYLSPGTYRLSYSVVDKDGKKVTSPLLGKTAYEITYSINGEKKTVKADAAGEIEIELKTDDVLDASVKITYLSGYTIVRSSADLGWPSGGLKIVPPPAGTMEVSLSGNAAEYKLSELADSAPIRVNFVLNGEPCTDEQLDGMEQLQVKVEGGNVQAKIDRDSEGYYVQLGCNGTAVDTDCGEFVLFVSGVYRNKDDQTTNVAQTTASFTVADNSRVLEMSVSTIQDYYQISQLKDGKPIKIKLSFSGDKLTQEELDGIKLEYTAEGVNLILEPDYDNSAYLARLDPNNPPSEGKHKIKFTATGVNEIGREQVLEDTATIEVGTLPQWLRLLIPILALLLIVLLVMLILNQKVLPKAVVLSSTEFVVDGEQIPGKGNVDFQGGGKKKGEIKIYSPKTAVVPMAEQAMFLTVTAVSPLRTKSKQRKAKVVLAKVRNPMTVTGWKLKTASYAPDPDKPGGFINPITGKQGFKEIEIGNNTEIYIEAQTESASIFFKAKIVFK